MFIRSRLKLAAALAVLLIASGFAGTAAAAFLSRVSGSGEGIASFSYGGSGVPLVEWEDTGTTSVPNSQTRTLVNKTFASAAQGTVRAGLWGTTTVHAPTPRTGPSGGAITRIEDQFTISAGISGLGTGAPVQIRFLAAIEGQIFLLGSPSGLSLARYDVTLKRGTTTLAELHYRDDVYPVLDLSIEQTLDQLVSVNIGNALSMVAEIGLTMNGSAHPAGSTQTNFLDFYGTGIARVGYAPGYENIGIASDAGAPLIAPSDYNGDGKVDAADYVLWRKNDGTQSGYDAWRANFGQTAASGTGATTSANTAIPEPMSFLLLLLAPASGSYRRRRH